MRVVAARAFASIVAAHLTTAGCGARGAGGLLPPWGAGRGRLPQLGAAADEDAERRKQGILGRKQSDMAASGGAAGGGGGGASSSSLAPFASADDGDAALDIAARHAAADEGQGLAFDTDGDGIEDEDEQSIPFHRNFLETTSMSMSAHSAAGWAAMKARQNNSSHNNSGPVRPSALAGGGDFDATTKNTPSPPAQPTSSTQQRTVPSAPRSRRFHSYRLSKTVVPSVLARSPAAGELISTLELWRGGAIRALRRVCAAHSTIAGGRGAPQTASEGGRRESLESFVF